MNPRISPATGDDVPQSSRPVLASIEKALGMVPNLHRTLAWSPATLKSYVAAAQSYSTGSLSPRLREQIAVAVAGYNGCGYCASAHTMLGKGADVSEAELTRNLRGESEDEQVLAALRFARRLIETRGAVDDADFDSLRAAGFGDPEIVEIVGHVGMNWFTNVFNVLVGTEIDFPVVEVGACSLGEKGGER